MHDTIQHVIFYFFSLVILVSALMAVTQNNPVRSVLFLVVTFFGSACLWLTLSAEFLALILVLVYVGAVMTLFLFVVMMLNIDVEALRLSFFRYFPFGLVLIAFLVGLMMVSIPEGWKTTVKIAASNETTLIAPSKLAAIQSQSLSNTEEIGMALFTQFVFAFELAALLLLIAIVAAIMLTLRKGERLRSKHQQIKRQIMTTKKERLSLVSITSNKASGASQVGKS